jgi:hypothetical protein
VLRGNCHQRVIVESKERKERGREGERERRREMEREREREREREGENVCVRERRVGSERKIQTIIMYIL